MKKFLFLGLFAILFLPMSVSAREAYQYDPNLDYIQMAFDYTIENGYDISIYNQQVAYVEGTYKIVDNVATDLTSTYVHVVFYNDASGHWSGFYRSYENSRTAELHAKYYLRISMKIDPDTYDVSKYTVLQHSNPGQWSNMGGPMYEAPDSASVVGEFIQSSTDIYLWSTSLSGDYDSEKPGSSVFFSKNYFGYSEDSSYTSVTIPQDKSLLLIPKGTSAFSDLIYYDTNIMYAWYKRMSDNDLVMIDNTAFAVTDVATSKTNEEMCKPFGWDNMVIDNCYNLPSFLTQRIEVTDSYLSNKYVLGIYNRADEDLIIKYNPVHFEALLFNDETTLTDSLGNIYNNPNSDFGSYNDNTFRPENNTDVDLVEPDNQFGSLSDLFNKIPDMLGVFGAAIGVIGLMINMFFTAMPSFVVLGFTTAFLMILIILIIKALR